MINIFVFFIPSIMFRFDLTEYSFTIGTSPQTYYYDYYERKKEFHYFTPFELSSLNIFRVVAFKSIGKNNAVGVGIIGFKSNYLWVADDIAYYDHLKSFLPLQICYIHIVKAEGKLCTFGNYGEISCWAIKDHDNAWMYLDYGLNINLQLLDNSKEN